MDSGRLCSHLLVKNPSRPIVTHCDPWFFERRLANVFPSSLFPVDQPIGLYHIDNHIWNFALMESCSCSSWNIHVLFTYWNGCGENLDRPSACMRAPFDSTNIKMERIERRLHRSGERRSPGSTVLGHSLPPDSGEDGIFGRQGNLYCSQ